MPAPTRQRSFSAKSQPESRPGPPRKKKLDPTVREYLRPDEVEAMVQATRQSGSHRVRDAAIILLMFRHGRRMANSWCCGGNRWIAKPATSMCIGSSAVTTPNILYGARSFACFGNSSAHTRTRRMSLCRSARRPCLHAPCARSWREQASWRDSPSFPILTNCGMQAVRPEIVETVANPTVIFAGNQGELLATREVEPGKYLGRLPRAPEDGFIITAFFTRKAYTLRRRQQLWPL